MGRAQARTIMERKWCAPAVPDRREPGAGPSGRPYFRSSIEPFLGQSKVCETVCAMTSTAVQVTTSTAQNGTVHFRGCSTVSAARDLGQGKLRGGFDYHAAR